MATWNPLAALTGHNHAYAGIALHDGEVWVIGGWESPSGALNKVSVLNLASGAWRSEAPLATATDPGPATLAVVTGVAYYVDDNGLHSLDLANGTQADLTAPSGATYGISLHELAGELFWLGPTPQAYHLSLDTWRPLAAPPFSVTERSSSALSATGIIYVTDGGSFASYDPAADAWTTHTSPTTAVWDPAMVCDGGDVILAAGVEVSTSTFTSVVQRYDPVAGTWSNLEALPVQGGPALGVNTGNQVLVISWAGATNALTLADPSVLEVIVSVELPVVTTDAYLTINLDVSGGPGVTADLLVTFTTGRAVTANALITVGVDDSTAPAWSPPTPSTPVGAPPLIPARALHTDEATQYPQIVAADAYDLAWGLGGQLTGSVTAFGAASDPGPEVGFNLEGAPTVSIEWGAEPPATRTHAYASPTVATATNEPLPELMPLDALPDGGGLTTGCLKPHTASLCSGLDITTRCAALELLPRVLPTRFELASAAAEVVGVSLFAVNGFAGLVDASGLVDEEYRTEGKTLQAVLDDLVLGGGAPHWFAPGAVIVHGGGLPAASFGVPDVRGASGSMTVQGGAEFTDPEPLLADYLADCRDEDATPGDPCDGETFETAASGTLSWTETAGAGLSYQEVQTTLTKSGGRIVSEEIITRRAIWTPSGNIASRFTGGGEVVIAPVEWTVREHTYLACCPGALAHTLERTWVTRGNVDPDATFETAPGAYLSAVKEVTQTWHAEGWLRARLETTQTHHGWTVGSGGGGINITPTYKFASRVETYVPIGRGMWHINTRVSDSILMPVGEGGDTVGTHWGEVINAYTVVTDAAPAQVTCAEDGFDACSGADCNSTRTADYARDHAAWVALRDAWAVNNPSDRLVTSVTFAGRVDVTPGAVTALGLVARVSWSGSGPRNDSFGESTTVEYWAAPE